MPEEAKAPERRPTSLNLIFAAISTALVCIATMFFSMYVPATRGFFNIGESMVYLSALLFGPFVGAFAGGVGSMLADILLGYTYYAPATLVIKASEGFIVGYLSRRNPKLNRVGWRTLTTILAVVAGALLAVIGSAYYSGEVELTLGQAIIPLYIPELFWFILSLIVTASIIVVGLVTEPEAGWTILSLMVGGLAMVLGYFIYQMYLLFPLFGIEAIAVAEIPVNIGQMIIGLIIATPVAKIIKREFSIGAK
ncbi:MAG: ECF transporter S component [Candidatus Bathyarchaeia archaeon]|nr:ECF transporter S component [Candidatus Bathyarchaeota archaeon]